MAKWKSNDIEAAKKIDMKDFLLKKEGWTFNSNGRCKQHDSLNVNKKNQWYWNSQNLHGYNAIDYLQQVYKMNFDEAMSDLGYKPEDRTQVVTNPQPRKYIEHVPTEEVEEIKELQLPERAGNDKRAFAYLVKTRGIDSNIVSEMMNRKMIYQEKEHNNVVFVGMDENNTPKFGCVRGTVTGENIKPFRMDCKGSDKEYAFRMDGTEKNHIFVFEAPIDALSKASIDNLKNQNVDEWKKHTYISLSGAAADNALMKYLESNKEVRDIYFCLDNDDAGRKCLAKYTEKYMQLGYTVHDETPQFGKDINDELKMLKENPNLYDKKRLEREIFIRKFEELKRDVLIIDPEREYEGITEALGGEGADNETIAPDEADINLAVHGEQLNENRFNAYSTVSSIQEIQNGKRFHPIPAARAAELSKKLESVGIRHYGIERENGTIVVLYVPKESIEFLTEINQTIQSEISQKYKKESQSNIIGNVAYSKLGKREELYFLARLGNEYAAEIAKQLDKNNVPYSGRIYGTTTTITVNKTSMDKLKAAVEIAKQECEKRKIEVKAESPTEELLKKIQEGMADVRNHPERMSAYLNTMAKFHNYSLNNIIAITMQKPDATYVAGIYNWKNNLGHMVNKGEKGIKILAPNMYGKTGDKIISDIEAKMKFYDCCTVQIGNYQIEKNTAGSYDVKSIYNVYKGYGANQIKVASNISAKELISFVEKNITNKEVIGFRVEHVFDLSQVSPIMVKDKDGKYVISPKAKELKFSPLGDVKEYDKPTTMRLFEAVSRTSNCQITFESTGTANGSYNPVENKIKIKESLLPTQALKTLIHERTHEELDNLNAEKSTRNAKEVRAESVAYVLCAKYGIDSSDYSFGYVQGWDGTENAEVFQQEMSLIKETADKLIKKIDVELANIQEKSLEQVVKESKLLSNKIFTEENAIVVAPDAEERTADDEIVVVPDAEEHNNKKTIVTIVFSEHPDIQDGAVYDFAEFNTFISRLDLKQQEERQQPNYTGMYYYKTSFQISGYDINNNPFTYSGRMDIGDGDGTVINHIQTTIDYEIKNPSPYNAEFIKKSLAFQEKVLPVLEKAEREYVSSEKNPQIIKKSIDFVPENLYSIESPKEGIYPNYVITTLSKSTGHIIPADIENNEFNSKREAQERLKSISNRETIVIENYDTMLHLAESAIENDANKFDKILNEHIAEYKRIPVEIQVYQANVESSNKEALDYDTLINVYGKQVNLSAFENKGKFTLGYRSSITEEKIADNILANAEQLKIKTGIDLQMGDVLLIKNKALFIDDIGYKVIEKEEFLKGCMEQNIEFNIQNFRNEYSKSPVSAIINLAEYRNITISESTARTMALLDSRISNLPNEMTIANVNKYFETSLSQVETIKSSKNTLAQIVATDSKNLQAYVGQLMPLSKLNTLVEKEKNCYDKAVSTTGRKGNVNTDIATFSKVNNSVVTVHLRMNFNEPYKNIVAKTDMLFANRIKSAQTPEQKKRIVDLKYQHEAAYRINEKIITKVSR